ncbi:MAG: hypothetical protein CMH48_01870 [Muricauda sp.]|uniref:PEGA domain-containing protein n=1 Tax=Flagellimonas lutaonensis TaxID=516051 RepID=A0A0D5YTT3_9FLAO|nr:MULTISPECIES: hypothetical protein [Allomuricauda]AKA35273.1 hypothetical protein VC82_1660 [Allomuricauda lutaonensis]MBC29569.1 hypothetical protein [Allomuricauda sp.]|tara:strand:+ start:761 stop:1183 length:423 start_codon:yes stop_codon:yes gene_type:complete
MKNRISIFFAVLFLSFQLTSCGVMFGGSRYNGTFIAHGRPNADIYINGEKAGQGQVTKMLKRDRPVKVEIKEEGCEPITKNFDNTFRTGNFILTVISWGILGIGVDLGTGAAYKPDHRNNPSIEKLTDKNFRFSIESTCE